MKKIFLTAIALCFLSGFGFSQTDIPLQYARTITEQGLKKQLTVVASAEMEGRETGTEGQRRAAAYIESQFKAIGLKAPESLNGYQQFYLLLKDTLMPKSLKIGKVKLEYGKDYILQPGSEEKNIISAKEIVFAGYGIEDKNYDDYAGKEVKGKIVLILAGEPQVNGKYVVSGTDKRSSWGFSTTRKASLAKEKGAVAVLLVNPIWDSIPGRITEGSKKTNLYFPRLDDKGRVPVITILPAFIRKIVEENEAFKILETVKERGLLNSINFDKKIKTKLVFRKTSVKVEASNVIGYVEGTDKKDDYVFLTAHYDHLGKKGDVIYYGADDDGSGTVSVIEMAQAFAKAKAEGHGPRRTVVFMTVSGEEKGLWGSEYYSDHPVFPLDKTTVDLNTDMIGRIDPNRKYGDSTNYVYVIGNDKLSSDLDPISKSVNEKYCHLELDYKYNAPDDPERIYYRSDHYNFARKGVPIIFFFDGIHKDYHKPSDTVDKINFDLMEKRARFIFLNAWEMANRDDMLKRDIPLPEEVR
ncbi:MAG: M28 family peptidase [Ginsengibacter sp.]